MNCHWVLFNNAGYLEPVRESYRTDKSIEWVRVHRLADYVYFNHSIHINKGVGCSSCHGQVNQMPLMFQASPLLMAWCLDCHRNPEAVRSEEHTSELQSHLNLVCRLLLEKKKTKLPAISSEDVQGQSEMIYVITSIGQQTVITP